MRERCLAQQQIALLDRCCTPLVWLWWLLRAAFFVAAVAAIAKAVSGVGGITPDTESFAIHFNNEPAALWFTTAGSGTPRVLIRRK